MGRFIAGIIIKTVCWSVTAFWWKHTDILLAVYNGEWRGGTAATMLYAQKMGREIIVIDPITRLVSHKETAPLLAHS